jgi:hypothetical protein
VADGCFKSWPRSWGGFLSKPENRAWYERRPHDQPVYLLPPEIVDFLARPRADSREKPRPPLLPAEHAEAERAFCDCCRTFQADVIGVWNGLPVEHALLGPASSFLAIPDYLIRKWRCGDKTFEQKKAALRALGAKEEVVHHNLLRRAGELVCDDTFLVQRDDLRRAWTRLRARPQFPLSRVLRYDGRGAATPKAKADLEAFAASLGTFLDRWELHRLDTWDLAVPVGPYEGMPVVAVARLYPDARISAIHPQHHAVPAQGQKEAVGRLLLKNAVKPRRTQAPRAEATGLYEWAYKLRSIELAFRSRYGTPHGYRATLTAAFVSCTRLSEHRVEQIVETYRPTFQIPK